MINPTDAPGFKEVMEEFRKPDPRPSFLVEGWHELSIDRARHLQHCGSGPVLFIVEGHVLRSTAPGFAGQKWAYVVNLRINALGLAESVMDNIVEASNSPVVSIVATEAELRQKHPGHFVWDSSREVYVVVLADTHAKKLRLRDATIISTVFRPR